MKCWAELLVPVGRLSYKMEVAMSNLTTFPFHCGPLPVFTRLYRFLARALVLLVYGGGGCLESCGSFVFFEVIWLFYCY